MLQIKNISKQYKTGDLIQNALKNVSLNFRDNEFVSILGPSGSGKTTLLNIIGGLDRYDSGDLIINNVSTNHYKDRDWDSYRNHTIGFVFQSYNLIPHQTVLANVELALTISGISGKERKERALEALDKVGLKEQAHKKPNQMSGGQMQRVAIARALVNNPDILLADEPTGALDTETSVQVMELLKKVAHDRLVIMVTHNPELAYEYSTRIVKLKDGSIIDDSNPYVLEEKALEKPQHKNLGKSSMSFATAMSLSFNNLLTKKGRTLLTAFAGSIGIIGIALILSLSTGFQNYIDQIQEDTLTSYPLTITSETADATSMLLSMVSEEEGGATGDKVEEKQYLNTMFSKIGTNDLKTFKTYLNHKSGEVNQMVSLVDYKYSVQPLIYSKNEDGKITQLNPSTVLTSMGMNSMMTSGMSSAVFNTMIDDMDTIEAQYDVLAGRWPSAYNEMILVLPEPNAISDLLVYSIGLRDNEELKDMMSKLMMGEKVENNNVPLEFTYEQLMNIPFKLVNPSDKYKYNAEYNIYEDMSEDEAFMKEVYEKSENLKIVGVVCSKEDENATILPQGIVYKKELIEYVINKSSESEIVKKQLANEDVNVFSNKRFDDESEEAGLEFNDMISIDENALAEAFGGSADPSEIQGMTEGYMKEISSAITADWSGAKQMLNNTFVTMATDMMNGYVDDNNVGGAAFIKASDVDGIVNKYMASDNAKKLLGDLEAKYLIPSANFGQMFDPLLKGVLQGYVAMAPSVNPADPEAKPLTKDAIEPLVEQFIVQEQVSSGFDKLAIGMTEAVMQKTVLTKVGEMTGKLMGTMADAFKVDPEKMASAFNFDMSEDELMRLMETMSKGGGEKSAKTNLIELGYQNLDEPTAINFYFIDFESKERFLDFLDNYNEMIEKEDDEKVIKYTDLTGLLMSSVKTIVDSVSYVLIAFVSISLVVSSIMIGIITYISVLERTKEIGVLRAIGASKKNISSIFNAETFIVGLFSGAIGIAVTLTLLPPINYVIYSLTNINDIRATLPVAGATVLIILSVVLTLIGGLIPSKQAAKKDPVTALRSE